MKNLKQLGECCGCTACYAVCPVDAITMSADEEGFLYPVVDYLKCIRCGYCESVCAFCDEYTKSEGRLQKSEYYAICHKNNEIRKRSRSGGAFAAFATVVLEQGGVVYGVALDEGKQAYTKRIESFTELHMLQGSKYVQSDKRNAFRQVKTDLGQGRTVLFSGTGCEVSGLLSYLHATKTNMSKLYTCDIVCHGVPSPLIWKQNVAWIKKQLGGEIDRVSFRDKTFGWKAHIESYYSGGRVIYSNKYTSLFYSHVCLRPACSECHFCNYERCGDFAVADFWGIENLKVPFDISEGVSLLMVQTERGKELLQKTKDDLDIYRVEKEQTEQPNLLKPSVSSPKREQFWEDYRRYGYKKTSEKYYGIIGRLSLVYNWLLRRNHK